MIGRPSFNDALFISEAALPSPQICLTCLPRTRSHLFHVYCAVAIQHSITEPVGSDKPTLQQGGFPPITTIAEILGNIWNSSGFSTVSAHSLYRQTATMSRNSLSLVSLYNRLSAQGTVRNKSMQEKSHRQRGMSCSFFKWHYSSFPNQ